MRNDFAVFILSHGRADRVYTIKTLSTLGYTGKTFLIIDDEDEQRAEYEKLPCDGVYVFSKAEEMEQTDTQDNFRKHGLVVYARNRVHGIANELGLKYFLMLDDDYKTFDFRYVDGKKLKAKKLTNLDRVFSAFVDFLEVSKAKTVCMAQAVDYLGGAQGKFFYKGLARKAMNVFFCKTDRPFKFTGSTNEDVNMYVTLGMRGELCFTYTQIGIIQEETQQQKGGLTETYLENGTYVKSFYSVMCQPSCVKVSMMGENHRRIHHNIKWDTCCPKILNARYKKGSW